MRKWLLPLTLMLLTIPAYADVNSDVQNCLTGTSLAPGGKAACVQGAINTEETNQITQLFQTYSNFVNQEINSGSFASQAPSGSGSGGGSSSGGGGASIYAPKAKAPAPAPAPSAAPKQATTPPPAPVAQPPKSGTQNQGGIQYY